MKKQALLIIAVSMAFLSCEKDSECYFLVTHFTHEKGSDIYNVLEVMEMDIVPENYEENGISNIFYSEQICQ